MKDKLLICGKQYKVIFNKKISGGNFNTATKKINVGVAGNNKEEILYILLHEVIEIILTERGHRFELRHPSENGDLIFIFNHEQYIGIIQDLLPIIRGLK